jgi:hypothetical protein
MTEKPQIFISHDPGYHNADLSKTVDRLERESYYRDVTSVLVIPTYKDIPPRVVFHWLNLYGMPNQPMYRYMANGMEVGEAYSNAFDAVISNDPLSRAKYVLTMEHDNAPPADGFVRLIECAEAHPEFAAISGLYFTKGEAGAAQIWGNPQDFPVNFRPQMPDPNGKIIECNGIGMGFAIFRTEMFRDARLRRPWFKTTASTSEGCQTQDLYFWSDAKKHGYRCAVDCSIRVGHYDKAQDKMW